MWKTIQKLIGKSAAQNPPSNAPPPKPQLPVILEQIGNRVNLRLGVGAGEARARKIEEVLGVQLPSSLRDIISTCGWVEFGDSAVLRGIHPLHDPERDIQAALSQNMASVPLKRFSKGRLIPLMYYGFGHEACLCFVGNHESDTAQIVLWPPHSAQSEQDLERVDVVATNFDEWITKLGCGEAGPW